MMRMVYTELGNISFELQRKRVKNLNLRVRSDGSVFVSVPYNVSYDKADEFVKSNCRFIFSAIEKIKREQAAEKPDKVYYLGEEVEIAAETGENIGGVLKGNRLALTVREDNDVQRIAALDMWRKQESMRLFPVICKEKCELFRRAGYDVPYPKISYKKMKSRWGSCTAAKGKISLNTMLIEQPLICIERVIVHELAHFVVQDHSARFYAVMDRIMPGHRAAKKMMR